MDTAFFDAIKAVFAQYPEAKEKYALSSLALESEMGISFERQCGLSRIEDGCIMTEFVDRDDMVPRMTLCLEWNWDYTECLREIQAPT
ncbi:hypothetical protein [Streptomyces sp. 8N706]|uniref:hypothetical protein n=1 Tax=Streptomyces sp. 8N706 TaxID=3457416 RepID=UPI003FD234AE